MRVHVLVLHRRQVDAADVAVHADHRRQARRQMQVGRLVLDHEGEQFGEIHYNPPGAREVGFLRLLQRIMTTILENLQAVKARIASAARAAGRDPASVTLLAVSKTQPVARVARGARRRPARLRRELRAGSAGEDGRAGRRDARPRVASHRPAPEQQDAARRGALRLGAHGRREKIARRLSEQRPAALPPLNVLIQVNVSGRSNQERRRAGTKFTLWPPPWRALPRLRLRGLMAIPEPGDRCCALLGRLKTALRRAERPRFGSTRCRWACPTTWKPRSPRARRMVRIGTAIFGARRHRQQAAA